MYTNSHFKAAWWLTNPHFQTITAKFLRRNLIVATIKETIELSDGDFIDLAWTEIPDLLTTKPIVVILHGLEGSKDSHYAKGMLHAIKQKGWIGVLMHFRNCSDNPNRLATSYHSGDTRDITFITQLLKTRYNQASFAILGFSLGGNVLTNFLAEQINSPYQAAAVICAPLDLSSCSNRINSGFSKLYQKYLVAMLKNKTMDKISNKLIQHISIHDLKNIKTIRDFDEYVTAPINGFAGADDYYQQVSGGKVIDKIRQPCLFIHSADDPFLCHERVIPQHKLPDNITFEVTNNGGHVGFITGKNPFKPIYWLEKRTTDFFDSIFTSHKKSTIHIESCA